MVPAEDIHITGRMAGEKNTSFCDYHSTTYNTQDNENVHKIIQLLRWFENTATKFFEISLIESLGPCFSSCIWVISDLPKYTEHGASGRMKFWA